MPRDGKFPTFTCPTCGGDATLADGHADRPEFVCLGSCPVPYDLGDAPDDPDTLLTTDEAAAFVGVSRSAFRHACRDRGIRGRRHPVDGRRVLYRRSDLAAFLSAHTHAAHAD